MASPPIIAYLAGRLPELWLRTGEHLLLTGCSTVAAVLIGVPFGILIFRNPRWRNPVMGAIGVIQTIPSLAMLAFLLALLNRIGVLPALIALTLYALLPIARNTLTGLTGVSPVAVEAARGIGMTESQALRMVYLPLAGPVILAGIRTAAVVCVGIATLSAFIGAGGLGQFINRGLALSDTRLIVLGAVPAALLALTVDFSLAALGWSLRPRTKRDMQGTARALVRCTAMAAPALLVLAGVLAYVTSAAPAVPSRGEGPVIRVATKNFTEQLILGEIMSQLIEARTDLMVKRRFNLGGTMICHKALVGGEIDLYPEYTGTGLTAVLQQAVIADPEAALGYVRAAYGKRFQLRWLGPFGFNNTYAVTVRRTTAEEHGWARISDLQGAAPGLRAGFTAEFAERPDGYPGLRKTYGLEFAEVRDLEPSLLYEAVAKGEVDIICAFATDGRILHYDLKPLEDDRGFFPPYHAAPVIREQTLRAHPELEKVLGLLEGALADSTMQALNYRVDAEDRRPAEVARSFLKSRGLLTEE